MSLRLRDYAYLDEDLVERLLSQLDRGLADEEEQTDLVRRGAAAAPGPDRERSASRTVRQTPDSACSRLIDELEAADSLQLLDTFDEEIWSGLKRGEALEIEGEVELSAVAQFGNIADSVGPIVSIMQGAGQEIEVEGLELMQAFSEISALMKSVPVIVKPVGAPDYTFIANLRREGLRVAQDQLGGEASLFGTLERRLRPDESWSIFDALGLAGLPREMRRQMAKSVSEHEQEEGVGRMSVTPPAALINPIAIYR
jgi:hypothetical protein